MHVHSRTYPYCICAFSDTYTQLWQQCVRVHQRQLAHTFRHHVPCSLFRTLKVLEQHIPGHQGQKRMYTRMEAKHIVQGQQQRNSHT